VAQTVNEQRIGRGIGREELEAGGRVSRIQPTGLRGCLRTTTKPTAENSTATTTFTPFTSTFWCVRALSGTEAAATRTGCAGSGPRSGAGTVHGSRQVGPASTW